MAEHSAEKDAREMAEAVVYDTLMDDAGEAEDADSFDLARRIVADLIESGARVFPPGNGGQHEPTNTRCDLYIEMVDPIEVTGVMGPIQRFWTCSLCCALVRDDYQEAHQMWHANAALATPSPQESQ